MFLNCLKAAQALLAGSYDRFQTFRLHSYDNEQCLSLLHDLDGRFTYEFMYCPDFIFYRGLLPRPMLSKAPVDSPLDPFRAGACHAIPGRFLRPTDIPSTNGSLSDGCNERHSLSSREGEGQKRRHGAERAIERASQGGGGEPPTNVRGRNRNDLQAFWPRGRHTLAMVRTVLMTSGRKGRTKRGGGLTRLVEKELYSGREAESGAAETKRLIAAISVALCCHFHCRLH